jgi:hypothetical protein
MKTETNKPKVGMPASYWVGSDCYAGRISAIEQNGRLIIVGPLHGVDPLWIRKFTMRKDGQYRLKGERFGHLMLGVTHTHTDRGF